jgi:DNA repair exonuclease SbcCD ATPase subunit
VEGKTFGKRWAMAGTLLALGLQCLAQNSLAADSLARARQLVAQTRAFPELERLSKEITAMASRLEASAVQLGKFRQAKVKARDPRYSALTREFNRERTLIAQLERKLRRPQTLNASRFPPTPDFARGGGPPGEAHQRMLAEQNQRLHAAQAKLLDALRMLTRYYDQQLRIIASVRS